jgi:hypothetical protein
MPQLLIPGFGIDLPDGPTTLQSLDVIGALTVGGAFSFQSPVFSAAIIAADLTIPAGYNALSGGPVAIGEGATVTVSDHSTWRIV